MGLEDTSFANPHGLDAPGHRASAADLAAIAEELMGDEVLAEIVSRREGAIPGQGGAGERTFRSHNQLLDIDPDADGVKTGMTDDAGYTLAAHARREDLGVELYAVLLGAPGDAERAADAKELLDWGFAQYARPTLLGVEQSLGEVDVTDRPGRTLPVRVERPLVATVRLDEPIEQRLLVPPRVDAPIAEGERVGVVVYRQGGRRLGRAPVVVAAGADAPTLLDRVRSSWDRLIA
jgi:D-alanyl-D-alanine carboxypeptidase